MNRKLIFLMLGFFLWQTALSQDVMVMKKRSGTVAPGPFELVDSTSVTSRVPGNPNNYLDVPITFTSVLNGCSFVNIVADAGTTVDSVWIVSSGLKYSSIITHDYGTALSAWYLKTPPSGVQAVRVRANQSAILTVYVCQYQTVNQTTPIGTAVSAQAYGTAVTATIVIASGEEGLSFVGIGSTSAQTFTASSPMAKTWERKVDKNMALGINTTAGASSDMTWTSGTSATHCTIAYPIKPAL